MPGKLVFDAGASYPELAEEVSSELALLARFVSPLLLVLGFPDDLKIVHNPRHEWLEDALLPNSGTINGGVGAGVTTLVLDTPEGLNFRLGDAVQIEGSIEIMTVVAPTPTATDVEVVRGARGTVAVAIPDNAILKRLNNPAVDNELAPAARSSNRAREENFTEIFREVASVSRTMQQSNLLAGIEDELEHQIDRRMKELMQDIAHTVIRGKQQAVNPEGTSSVPRTMDGIIQRILGGASPSVTDALGGGLSEALVNTTMQDMWTKGGTPRLLAAPPAQRRRLSALLQGRQRFQVEDSTLGAVVTRFQSDFGTIDVLEPDIFIPQDTVLILDTAKIRVVKLGEDGDPFEVLPLAQEGLSFRREIVSELGLEIANAGTGGHAMIQNLSIS